MLSLGKVRFPSGAGGSRTRVQTCCKSAFYMFSRRLLVGFLQVRDQPTGRLSSKISPMHRSLHPLAKSFTTLLAGRRLAGLPGKRPRLICDHAAGGRSCYAAKEYSPFIGYES